MRRARDFFSDIKSIWRGDHIYQKAAAENTRAKFDHITSVVEEIKPKMTVILNENASSLSQEKLGNIFYYTQRLVGAYTLYNFQVPDSLRNLMDVVFSHEKLSDEEYDPITAAREIREQFLKLFI